MGVYTEPTYFIDYCFNMYHERKVAECNFALYCKMNGNVQRADSNVLGVAYRTPLSVRGSYHLTTS